MNALNELITPEWLTQALTAAGLLDGAEVVGVMPEIKLLTDFSTPKIALLEIAYSRPVSAPDRLAFKLAHDIKEHLFFTEVAAAMTNAEVVHCYHAEYNSKEQRAIFLLEDLSATHFYTEWPLPPSWAACVDTVECLARIHAGWWDQPRLGADLKEHCSAEDRWVDRIDLAITRLPDFLDFMGDRLAAARQQIYEKVLAAANQDWRPNHTPHGATLLHGDAHFWNFMYPRANSGERVRIIDWSLWDIGRATDDLAYMIGLHWYPARRREHEQYLLRRYLAELQGSGVPLTWDQLWLDYRRSAIMNLFIPVWQWQRGINPAVWWSHLERGFLAYQDLACDAVL